VTEKHLKRPRDLNQWAKRMVDIATMDEQERSKLIETLKHDAKDRPKPRHQTPGNRGSD